MFRLAFKIRFNINNHWNGKIVRRYIASKANLKTVSNESIGLNLSEEIPKNLKTLAVPVIVLPPISPGNQTHSTGFYVVPELNTSYAPVLQKIPIKETTSNNKQKESLEWKITPSQDKSQYFKYYLKLSKFRLSTLVVITSMGGYAMAPAPFDLGTFLLCAIGTGLTSGAANAINQYHEIPFDSQMSRTKNRVLVTGLLTPAHAVGFAITSASIGLATLYYGCNEFTAALGLGNLILYTYIYTPMKRFSILNTWVGSVVGAIPPLMGWAACAGSLDTGAWILAGLLYAWQFPHFNALSWNLRPDYSRAGYRMMSVTNPGLCRRTALRYTLGLGVLSLTAPLLDVTNVWFALETLPLNGYFAYLAWKFYQNSDSGSSRKLFRFSLIHLPALMILFLLNKKRWIFFENNEVPVTAAAAATGIIASPDKLLSTDMPNNQLTLTKILPVALAVPETNESTTFKEYHNSSVA